MLRAMNCIVVLSLSIVVLCRASTFKCEYTSLWANVIEIDQYTNFDCRSAMVTDVHMDAFRLGHNGSLMLKTLDLSKNLIGYLPFGVFDRVFDLRVLQVSDNQIEKLVEGLLSENSKLTEIDFSGNSIHTIEGSWRHLTSLRKLDLSSNQLHEFPAKVFGQMVMEFATDPDTKRIKNSYSRKLLLGDNKFDCDCDLSWTQGIGKQGKLPTDKIHVDETKSMAGQLDQVEQCKMNEGGVTFSIGDFMKSNKRSQTKKYIKSICEGNEVLDWKYTKVTDDGDFYVSQSRDTFMIQVVVGMAAGVVFLAMILNIASKKKAYAKRSDKVSDSAYASGANSEYATVNK